MLQYLVAPFQRILRFSFSHMMQAERDEANLGLANSRIPPTWSVERDKVYPLRYYRHDLEVWSASTDMDPLRQGPAASMRITGAARLIVREMPIDMLVQGRIVDDGQGNMIQLSGLGMLLRTLERLYGATTEETQVHSISELMQFARQSGESTDEVIARFDVLVHCADTVGGVQLGAQLKAWLLLTHLRIPRSAWMVLLAPTNGLLPQNIQEYTDFQQYVRRNGHLHDQNHGDRQKSIAQPYYVEQSDGQTYFGNSTEEQSAYSSTFWNGGQSSYYDDDSISWHSFSTGHSDEDEPIDWENWELTPDQNLGEEIYLAYRSSKRRWRHFGGKSRPRFKGRGRKGKGKGKGKNHHPQARAFWTDDFGNNIPILSSTYASQSYPDESSCPIYFKGKGKGGNPIGKDGLQMLCSICNSDQHFRLKCPQAGKGGKGKGKGGKSKGTFWTDEQQNQTQWLGHSDSANLYTDPSQPQSTAASSVSASLAQPRKSYFAVPNSQNRNQESRSCIFFSDGTAPIPLIPNVVSKLDWESEVATTELAVQQDEEATTHQHLFKYYHPPAYSWFGESIYHARVRLLDGEALLVDTGAVGDLTGELQFIRMAALAKKNGHGTSYTPLRNRMSIEGVGGGGPSVCTQTGTVSIVLANGQLSSYTAPIIPESEVPSLVGLTTMTRQRVVLDLVHDKWITLGPGGMEMKLSPGSKVLPLHRAPTGHIMLPCSEWEKVNARAQVALTASLQ